MNDLKKKNLCEAHGVHLIYFTYQEEITPELVRKRLSQLFRITESDTEEDNQKTIEPNQKKTAIKKRV